MYTTLHQPTVEQLDRAVLLLETPSPELRRKAPELSWGQINFTIWSDVFICPECAGELIFWDVAVDKVADKVNDEFSCLHCNTQLTKRSMERSYTTYFDDSINQAVRQAKQVPVVINYSVGKKRFKKKPDKFDLALIESINNHRTPYWFPTNRMPEGDESRRNDDIGITHVHHFYSKRNIWSLGAAFSKSRNRSLFLITAIIRTLTKMFRWAPKGKHTAGTSGTLYIPSLTHEYPIFGAIERRIALYKELLSWLTDKS